MSLAEEFMPFLTPTGDSEKGDYINAACLPVTLKYTYFLNFQTRHV